MTILFQVDKFLIMEFTTQVKIATDPIYQKVSKSIPEIEWATHAPVSYTHLTLPTTPYV